MSVMFPVRPGARLTTREAEASRTPGLTSQDGTRWLAIDKIDAASVMSRGRPNAPSSLSTVTPASPTAAISSDAGAPLDRLMNHANRLWNDGTARHATSTFYFGLSDNGVTDKSGK
jgi:hypothetical protein